MLHNAPMKHIRQASRAWLWRACATFSLALAAGLPPSASAQEEEPGRVVVDEEEAERALERSLVVTGALLLPPGRIEVAPSVTYLRDEGDATIVLPEGIVADLDQNIDEVIADLNLRMGLPFGTQLELGLPYRWRQVESVTRIDFSPVEASSDSASGIGDLRVGFAAGLLRERAWRPDLIARLTWISATGSTRDEEVPLGSGFHQLRGSLTAVKRQDPLVFVGSLAYEHVFEDDDVRPGDSISPAATAFLAVSPETSLRFGVAQEFQRKTEVNGQRIDGSDRTAAVLELGASSLLGRGVLLDVTAGIGITEDAPDFVFGVSLPIQFSLPLFY